MASYTTRWATRSRSAHSASGRQSPLGLGTSTRLTGCGRYVPFISSCRSASSCSCGSASNLRMLTPSTPAAPALARTTRQARRMASGEKSASGSVLATTGGLAGPYRMSERLARTHIARKRCTG